ncbi:MAG: hypothetical protein EZS28_010206 [Streblomastix strix]|uniref:Uncharacterized protein n=1 Tax=Streblomastix strix TaxID=222440 RepID=A0A5J4WGX2_9EUKA|nr:MAG: hypothetical protein EZS28_010206 [Streblomastix strix]
MSAQANLQGLFEDQFKKQPYPVFPIHSWSQETDYLLKAGSLCQDPIDKILSKIYEQDEYKEKEKDNQDLLNKLQQTGDFKQPIFLTNISKVADPLLCAIHHNYSQFALIILSITLTLLLFVTLGLSAYTCRLQKKNKIYNPISFVGDLNSDSFWV